jgi:ribosomal protein S18 acetylase RimI-like enzyme
MLAVRSDRQRQGIGRRLMAAAHEWVKERKLAEITLNVWEFNHQAVAFYQALGYDMLSRIMVRSS